MAETARKVLMRLDGLKMHFPLKKERASVKAVDGVTLDIYEGETVGLVGESGCGKTTLGRLALKLYKPTAGRILYYGPTHNEYARDTGQNTEGIDLAALNDREMRRLRRHMQIVFQDPYSSLNPRLTMGNIVSEALVAHRIYRAGSRELEQYTLKVMEDCGLQRYMLHRYPHQFSGGQRQRIGIARALALKPGFLVCDEAVSALDVSIQSQIINLLIDLKEQYGYTSMFISHDLSTVKFISDRVGVMYLGNIIELGESQAIYDDPLHPYTEALLGAIPTTAEASRKELKVLEGDIPSPVNPPPGCKFHTRCQYAKDICKIEYPEWRERKPKHFVACHFPLSGNGHI